LGLPLKGVHTALDVERGMNLLKSMIDDDSNDDNDQDVAEDDLIVE